MIVLSWSRATRDLLKSFSWGIGALHRLTQRGWCHLLAACPIASLGPSRDWDRSEPVKPRAEDAAPTNSLFKSSVPGASPGASATTPASSAPPSAKAKHELEVQVWAGGHPGELLDSRPALRCQSRSAQPPSRRQMIGEAPEWALWVMVGLLARNVAADHQALAHSAPSSCRSRARWLRNASASARARAAVRGGSSLKCPSKSGYAGDSQAPGRQEAASTEGRCRRDDADQWAGIGALRFPGDLVLRDASTGG